MCNRSSVKKENMRPYEILDWDSNFFGYKVAKIIRYWPHPEPPYHLYQFSKKTIQKLLQLTGFEVVEIIDEQIPITYSFGNIKCLMKSPKKLLYACIFVPVALLGPMLGSGDIISVVAKKT